MSSIRFYIQTFGCKVNQYESSAIANSMLAAGYEAAESPEGADIVIINSCSVTGRSDEKAAHAVRAAKRTSHGAVTVLCGCFPQAFPDAAKSSGADIIAGTSRRGDIPRLVKEFLAGKAASADMSLPERYEELPDALTAERTRAFIKIEDGCDRYCSYCVIPYARGAVRSRTPESVGKEAALCAAAGHREVVLVGINLSRYGSDIGCGLADAVSAASQPESIARVRLSSLEPELMDEETVRKLAECGKLCPHFHLSLQSGCDATLKRMNRHYSAAEYREITERLCRYFPGCAITTDIMVGFCGETDEEFEQSLRFAESVGFARIHVFTYSVRAGTAAAKRADHIPEPVKAERYARMSQLADSANKRFLAGKSGEITEILVQKRTSPDFAAGLTADYAPVRVFGSAAQRHDIIKVRITGAENGFCIGEEI